MKETIGDLRHENTAIEAEILCLRSPKLISDHTSVAPSELNVTEASSE